MIKVINVTSCYDCPLNHNIDISISSKRHITIIDKCISLDSSVEEYSKIKEFHPECPLSFK